MNDENYRYVPIYTGWTFDYEDIYEKIKKETGLDIKDNPDYYIGYTGASDDDGISETFTTDFVVYRKIKTRGPIVPPKPPIEDLTEDSIIVPPVKGETKKIPVKPPVEPPIEVLTEDPPIEGNPEKEPVVPPVNPPVDDKKEDPQVIPPEELEPEKILEEKPTVIRVVRRKKNNLTKILATIALALALLAPLGKEAKTIIEDAYMTTSSSDLSYSVSKSTSQLMQELKMVSMNDFVVLPNGLIVHNDSLLHGHTETIGDENKHKTGAYEVTGFGVSYNGKLLDYIENFNGEPMNVNLGDFAQKVCDEYGISVEDIDITIHFGNGRNNTRAGWADASKVIKDIADQKKLTYNGVVDDFIVRDEDGNIKESKNFIEIKTETGTTKIPIYDTDGKMHKVGDVVTGDDGNLYLIEKIDELENDPVTQTYQKQVAKTKITYSLRNVTELDMAAITILALAALANALNLRRVNKNLAKSPYYHQFESPEEENKFMKEFTEDTTQKRITKIEDRLKRLTPEEMKNLYRVFINLSTPRYTYEPGDKLDIREGNFIVIRDNETIDITDIMIELLNEVLDNSLYDMTGLLRKDGEVVEIGKVR